jgi:hypothetical protein
MADEAASVAAIAHVVVFGIEHVECELGLFLGLTLEIETLLHRAAHVLADQVGYVETKPTPNRVLRHLDQFPAVTEEFIEPQLFVLGLDWLDRNCTMPIPVSCTDTRTKSRPRY